jgi:hypothetical protein
VYDECDAAERRAVEEHLESCHVCRHEIGGLRKVRQDLLAWDVPEQAPVWRPVVPVAAPVSPWSAIPAWAMSAAAGLLLMVGAAGGAVTYALLPRATPQVAAVTPAERPAPAPDVARVAALEQRIADLEKAASERPAAANVSVNAGDLANVRNTVSSLVRRMDDLDYAVARTAINTAEVRTDQQRLRNFVQISSAGVPAGAPGFGGAR